MLNYASFQLRERKRDFTENWSAPVRGTLMLRALGDYGRLMVFPGNLHMERSIFDPGNYLSRESWRKTVASEYLSILGLVVLAAFIYGCAKTRHGSANAHHGHGLVFCRLSADLEYRAA